MLPMPKSSVRPKVRSINMDRTCYTYLGKSRSQYILTVVLGVLCLTTVVQCLEYRRVSRKLHSSPEPLDTQLSNEDLRQWLSILEGTSKEMHSAKNDATTDRASAMQHNAMILPELMRIRPVQSRTTTTTTSTPPVSRVTTRRFYRRLRRKTTTTESPATTLTTLTAAGDVESSRMLPTGASPSEILHQLALLNGILGALNSTAQAPTPAQSPDATTNANINATPVPDFLALFTGAKSTGEASSKSEVVVPPPPPPPPSSSSPSATQVDDPAAALALLNLFSNNGGASSNAKDSSENGNNAANNLLNLVAQSQQAAVQPVASSQAMTQHESDATAAALTKLLLQSSSPAGAAMNGNSIVQHQTQQQHDASASQVQNLLGLLGTLGAASQQSQSGNINQFFSQGGDQIAQAQTTNSLAHLFGQQTQQQQVQAQNLLSLLGGNQGNQGLNLASLLAPQGGGSIPGLGLLSTMSSLGSSIFSTVSNIFGGSSSGKPRVRGKGVDTRVGLGYRLGNIGDAQVVWDIGPQLFTDPLRNEARQYTQKRESGPPAVASHYFQSTSDTATEKEVQQIEAKRRMVQAAIQDHYRGNRFASVYPKPQQSQRRSHNHYDYNRYSHYYPEYSSPALAPTQAPTPSTSSSSMFSSIPFADHLKGFWTGLTSGIAGSENHEHKSSAPYSHYYNFDDVRSDFSTNLIKRSSPDYTEYQSRAFNPRQMPDEADVDDPTHSTLTEYERMLLHYGKDIGVANTKHGVVKEEPRASESGFFARWFTRPSSSAKPTEARMRSSQQSSEWSFRSNSNDNSQPQKSVKKSFHQPSPSSPPASSASSSPFGYDGSFLRRNNHPHRRNGPRPQKRRSHNPFRNWIVSLKQSAQRPRASHPSTGFGRRHFKRPSVSGNPKLQHFTNTNKDLMMADANNDFVESAGVEAYNSGYTQPIEYNYANEFPDVSLTMPVPPRRSRPKNTNNGPSKVRASLSQREKIVEPALLYDHLEASEGSLPEVDESFHQRNKVVVDSLLKEREKQKILGTLPSTAKTPTSALTKIQRLRLQNKLRVNSTGMTGKQKIVVKIKGDKGTTHHKIPSVVGSEKGVSESTTSLPSMLSTIASIFKGTTKPKLLDNLIHNATSMFPSISSIRILPRKKKKEQVKTKLTLQNGRPAVVAVPDPEPTDSDENDLETAANGDEAEPVVQVGHDMSFTDLQNVFVSGGKNNGTKKRRFRIRVKESVLRGEKDKDDKERKDSDEEDEDGGRDIFVDIESGEVSVLKPVASLVSFNPKKEEVSSDEEEVDYYEDDDGDGVADADMKRKEHIFEAIQKELVKNFEKMKKAQQKADAKKKRKQELAEKGVDESIDDVMKYFDPMEKDNRNGENNQEAQHSKPKQVGGLSM